MSLCYIWSIFPATILALDVMVIVALGRRRHITDLPSTLLNLLHLLHVFQCVLELLVLNLPLRVLSRLIKFLRSLLGRSRRLFLFGYLYSLALTNLFVLRDPIAGELSTTFVTFLEVLSWALHIVCIG